MERLVRKAQRGDKNAFMALIEKNQLALYRAAKAILHREEDVEDAVQETICKAFDKQLDALFGEEALDISTDITVLENMMAREGLTEQPLKAESSPKEDPDIKLEL